MANMISRALLPLLAMSTLAVGACAKDPYDPQTWIDKLDDTAELEAAITELERLRCPVAIKPLGKVWEKQNRWSKVLRVIIDLADQPDMGPGNPKWENVKNDCKNPGNGPYWENAVPILITALEDFDVTNENAIQDAAIAAEALGKSKSPDAVQVLISAATKKEKLRAGLLVRIAAIKALGAYGNNPRAVETLIKILETDPEGNLDQVRLNASAANALADTGAESAVLPLLKALYEIAPIYQQVRRAITTIGKPAVPELIKVFKGNHAEINKLAAKHKFATDCDKGEGPGTTCEAPGNLRFKAATLLGDLRAKEAAPAMLAALKQKEQVSFFDPRSGAPGPSDHSAILDALRVMGAFDAAEDMGAYMKAESTNDVTRPLAIDAYSMLANTDKELDWLAKTFQDQENEEPMRNAARLAYSRLVTQDSQLKPIQAEIDAQLKEATAADKKADKAKKEDEKKEFSGQANDYRGFARQIEQYRTRARVGIVCKSDVACYKDILTLPAEKVVEKLKIPNHRDKDMTKQDMAGYRIAALERALFELAKMGKKAEPVFDDLLTHAESTERIIRQGVLLAMVQVAPQPCNKCATRLSAIIEGQSAQTTLDALTADTRIVLNYFLANGAKVEGVAKAEAKPAE